MYGKLALRLAIVCGGLMFLVGIATTVGYLLLALVGPESEDLAVQMGLLTPLWVGVMGGGLLVYYARHALAGQVSRLMTPYQAANWWPTLALGVSLGLISFRDTPALRLVFPVFFALGAAAPVLAVVNSALLRLSSPLTWRRASIALLVGMLVSAPAALLLEVVAAVVAIVAVALACLPAVMLHEAGEMMVQALLEHPLVGVTWIVLQLVVVAPVIEEAVKALGLPILGRGRITSEREAFLVGTLCGAGFAIVENMLYESGAAQHGLTAWLTLAGLRGLGAIVHPLGTGLIAVGWYRSHVAGWRPLLKAYLSAVGLHALWNLGAVAPTVLALSSFYLPYASRLSMLLAVLSGFMYLPVLAFGLRRLMRRLVTGLADAEDQASVGSGQPPAGDSPSASEPLASLAAPASGASSMGSIVTSS